MSDDDETRRLDSELVRRGLARSRGQAHELVSAGRVSIDGRPAVKPAAQVTAQTRIELAGEPDRYVSRAAHKLLAALDAFPVDPAGRRCVDVGASTGGFTQVLLERGAASVAAIDVGHGQLVGQLADDPRVHEFSGTTVRDLDPAVVGGPFEVLVADLSFISIGVVAADLARLAAPGADAVLLVKPQFEVGRQRLGKGGIVSSWRNRSAAIREAAAAVTAHGLPVVGIAASPVTGTDGNAEYLLHCRRIGGREAPDGLDPERIAQLADDVTRGETA